MTTFRHIIGKSTLSEGMSVPKEHEAWIRAPAAGHKREIKLLFDGSEARATLRRIANERGNVQIKYENEAGLAFREWLTSRFACPSTRMEGEYLELERVEGDTFRVSTFPCGNQPSQRLEVKEWIFHRANEGIFEDFCPLREIPAVVRSVEFNVNEGQGFYNRQLSLGFKDWNWGLEKLVIPSLPLKSDFLKDGVQVEVEFGNARTYYQDYIKFMLAFNLKQAQVGVLVVPSEDFARSLCSVGRIKAEAKGRHSYSGMIHIEKVRRELSHLAFMLNMPVIIAAIGVQKKRPYRFS